MRNNEVKQLKEDLNKTNERIDDLVKALCEAEVLRVDLHSYESFHPYEFFTKRETKVREKIRLILNHLGLEFEWIESHYELKEKKEDK